MIDQLASNNYIFIPTAKYCPSGDQAKDVIGQSCCPALNNCRPNESQTRQRQSSPPDIIRPKIKKYYRYEVRAQNSVNLMRFHNSKCYLNHCILPLEGDQSAVSMRASWAFHTIGLELGVRDLIFKLQPVANKTDWESDDHATAYTGVTFCARVDLQGNNKRFSSQRIQERFEEESTILMQIFF